MTRDAAGVVTIREFEIVPEDAGLPRATLEQLKGRDPAYNAAAIRGVLQGSENAFRDIVLLNAGAALTVAGKAATLKEGATLAARAIASGQATAALDKMLAICGAEKGQ
jgi:anthranilate phosphoribosyltransferase